VSTKESVEQHDFDSSNQFSKLSEPTESDYDDPHGRSLLKSGQISLVDTSESPSSKIRSRDDGHLFRYSLARRTLPSFSHLYMPTSISTVLTTLFNPYGSLAKEDRRMCHQIHQMPSSFSEHSKCRHH